VEHKSITTNKGPPRREQLLANGVEASEIEDGTPGPGQEMRVTDPDGYVLMIAQTEPEE
jgi:hypothetical protein